MFDLGFRVDALQRLSAGRRKLRHLVDGGLLEPPRDSSVLEHVRGDREPGFLPQRPEGLLYAFDGLAFPSDDVAGRGALGMTPEGGDEASGNWPNRSLFLAMLHARQAEVYDALRQIDPIPGELEDGGVTGKRGELREHVTTLKYR